tara:strand:+ start:620 stop:3754 length:3135 start_codon:yes stop_codon:yes gene_type:complete
MSFNGLAQKAITGTVVDENGNPLPGATVLVKGTSSGVASDFDGNYSITANEGDTLVFSFIGFSPNEVTVGASNIIDVSIFQDASSLKEVVVTAYGTQKRESIAGAVSIIDSDQIENATFSNAVKSLEGLVSGLRVIQSSGQPGSDPIIRIRGFGSINADNSPLIVLDGVPYSGSINSINPQDIETTSVLKDANSTSLYGNKASNGVLMITTKKGAKNRKPQISIDTRMGVTQRGVDEYNITSTPGEFYETYHSILANSEFYRSNDTGTALTFSDARQFASNNLIGELGYNLYDVAGPNLVDPATGRLNSAANLLVSDRWEDALFRDNADFTSTNVNISGGADTIDYYFSMGSEDNNGYTVQSNFKRKTARLKVNIAEIADVISIGGDVSYAKSNSQFVPLDGSGSYNNAFQWTRSIAPIYPVYQYDQNWNPISGISNNGFAYDMGQTQTFADGTQRGPRQYGVGEHPLAHIEQSIVTNETDNFNTALRAKIDLPYDIKFEYILNYLTEIDKSTYFSKPGSSVGAASLNGNLDIGRNNFAALTNQQLLTWKKEDDRHSFDVLLGHETYQEKFTTLSVSKSNIIGTLSPILDNTAVYNSASNYNTKYTTEGYFSRFIYGLDNTYYVNLTGRYDASSVFHPDERWGIFWSAGASWIMSNEDFFSSLDFIDYAKLAANYGTSGNDRIFYSGSSSRNLVAYESQYVIDENNGALTQGLYSLGGRDITWEKSASYGVNLEMSLFNSLNLGLGYYSRTSEDLLFNKPLQPSTGQDSRPENFGSMKNSGVELDVAWTAIKKEKFSVVINANLSTLKNEITELPRDSIQVGNYRRVVGKSAYDYYMVESAGVNSVNGNAQFYTTDSNSGERVITEDYNDAVQNGRTFIGKSAIPDITGGFGTNIEFGDFALGLQFAYQIGGYGLDNVYYGLLGLGSEIRNVVDYDQTWTVDNPSAILPRVDPLANDQYRNSDLRLTNLDYLSLANVNFGYTIQNQNLDKYNIESLRIYGIVNNASLLYSARQGYDPRLNSLGASSGEYGANRTLSVGVNINLK